MAQSISPGAGDLETVEVCVELGDGTKKSAWAVYRVSKKGDPKFEYYMDLDGKIPPVDVVSATPGCCGTSGGTPPDVPQAFDDVVPDLVEDNDSFTATVGGNDKLCPGSALTTFELVPLSENNVTVSNSPNTDGAFDVRIVNNPDCPWGDWSFRYKILCDGNDYGTAATVSGRYCLADQTGDWQINAAQDTFTDSVTGIVIDFDTPNPSTAVINETNGNFNPGGAGFWSRPLEGQRSAQMTPAWDTSPERGGMLPDADVGTGRMTIRFPCEVTNPVLHIDRLGGRRGNTHNGLRFDLVSGPSSLTKLAGTTAFEVGANYIRRSTSGQSFGPTGFESAEGTGGTEAGSVRLNGTFTEAVFTWTGEGIEGAGRDAIEIILSDFCGGV